jgi:hypothetical protein
LNRFRFAHGAAELLQTMTLTNYLVAHMFSVTILLEIEVF